MSLMVILVAAAVAVKQVVVAKAAFDWAAMAPTVIVPIVVAIISFFGGRKTAMETKKSEFETLKQELEAFKAFRDLLVSDNLSLINELKSMKAEVLLMKEELKILSKSNCSNFPECKNRKQI